MNDPASSSPFLSLLNVPKELVHEADVVVGVECASEKVARQVDLEQEDASGRKCNVPADNGHIGHHLVVRSVVPVT